VVKSARAGGTGLALSHSSAALLYAVEAVVLSGKRLFSIINLKWDTTLHAKERNLRENIEN
jgi:hypothetical protein